MAKSRWIIEWNLLSRMEFVEVCVEQKLGEIRGKIEVTCEWNR